MTYIGASLAVLGATAAAALASWLVDRFIRIETRRRHHEVGAQVFQQVGVLFAVLLAFVFSEVWGEYNTAAQAINGECGALHGASMLANALPGHVGRPVNAAIVDYGRSVTEDEWPRLAERHRSTRAAQDFRIAYDMAARLPVTAPADVAIRSQVVSLLAEAHGYRETRTFQASLGLPLAMWGVLISMALILESFVLFAGIDTPGHMLLAVSFTLCSVMVLVVIRMLDFPFEGALAISNADFVKMTGEVSDMVAGR